MSKIIWDNAGERLYETGVKNAVLYVYDTEKKTYGKGVAWNGVTSVSESPDGAEAEDLYADDSKYLSLLSTETFGASIEAYTYPDEFAECDGSAEIAPGVAVGQQSRKTFGLTYRTTLGNDEEGNEYGYKIHIIYGCVASPSDKEYSTINDSPEAISFSWDIKTTPVNVGTINGVVYKPTATMVIDSTKVADKAKLAAIENYLYGTDEGEGTDPQLPLPAKVLELLNAVG